MDETDAFGKGEKGQRVTNKDTSLRWARRSTPEFLLPAPSMPRTRPPPSLLVMTLRTDKRRIGAMVLENSPDRSLPRFDLHLFDYFGPCWGGFSLVGGTIPLIRK